MATWAEFVECDHDCEEGTNGPCIHCGAPFGICDNCGLYDWLWEETNTCADCEDEDWG